MRNMNEEINKIGLEDFENLYVLSSCQYTDKETGIVTKVKAMIDDEKERIIYAISEEDKEHLVVLIADLNEVGNMEIEEEEEECYFLGKRATEYFETYFRDEEEHFIRFATFSTPKILWTLFEEYEKKAELFTEAMSLMDEE